jgi:hypothetical protein
MNLAGETDPLLLAARSALLDALEALDEQRDAVIVVGAQAVYLRTGAMEFALAEATKDSDLAIDPRELSDNPHIEAAMIAARFHLNPSSNQPGAWMSPAGIPVDLMVPEAVAGAAAKGTRGSRLPPHSNSSMRRTRGLEAALVDRDLLTVTSLDPAVRRAYDANVAGPGALVVAKLHKLGEREMTPVRLVDKDAHDLFRLLRAVPGDELELRIRTLLADDLSQEVTELGLVVLEHMFADPESTGSMMAGRAEEGVGSPAEVSQSVTILARELLDRLGR